MLYRSFLVVVVTSVVGGTSVRAQSVRFEDVSQTSGVAGALAGMLGHGGAWGDFDNDGDPDLFVGGFCDRPDADYAPAEGPVPARLLRNRGDGKFEIVDDSIVAHSARTSGAVFADLDNDGWLDLFVANNARRRGRRQSRGRIQDAALRQPSRLFRNERGTFRDVTDEFHACPDALESARNVAVWDYDGDGWLDLLLVEDRFTQTPGCVLLRNRQGQGFQQVTSDAGFPENVFGLGHALGDVNADGRPDLFLGHSNRFFLSTPDGRFEESDRLNAELAWEPLHGEDWPCGAALADLNRDGRLDLVLAVHCETARNRIYLNEGLQDGVPHFRNVTAASGLPDQFPVKCPHVEVCDFDNDGWPDLYFSAGWLDDRGRLTPCVCEHLGVLSDGVPQFRMPRSVEEPMVYYPAGPTADFDRDGRVDLMLVNWFQTNHSRLLRNRSSSGNWLNVRFECESVNRMGIGSRVTVSPAGSPQNAARTEPDATPPGLWVQELHVGTGYASGQCAVLHFGVGQEQRVNIHASLPNGLIVERSQVPVNQTVILRETMP